jgi:myo-inositol-1(or 4)-monophosphatase
LPEPDLALLEAAAAEAGAYALARVGAPGAVREKPDGGGPVSETDLGVDAMLRARLTAARPDYGWLSEESEDDPARLATTRVFIVDPIDGTRAYLAGQPAWALSLAVAEAGRVVAGVVHLPALGLSYAAAEGRGARANGRPIAVSPRAELEGAEVLANGNQLEPRFWPGGVPRVSRHFRPSMAYRFCLVAEGRFDALFTFRDTWEWDAAAGALIVREAGGVVTTRAGDAPRYNQPRPLLPGVVAAGAALQQAIVARL